MENFENIQFLSDLHLEFLDEIPNDIIIPNSKNIALLGDIGDPFSIIYNKFLDFIVQKFEKIFIIAGNHEYYNNEITETKEKLLEYEKKYNNLFFLDNKCYEFENITILGTTLWSRIYRNAVKSINDFRYIRLNNKKITQDDYINFHNQSVEYIKEIINKNAKINKKILILSHYAPHTDMNGIYKDNDVSSAFSTNLTEIINYPIVGWLCGHTHQNIKICVNNVQIISNCVGYKGENCEYKNKEIFELKE